MLKAYRLKLNSGLLPTGLGADAACAVRSFSVRSLQGSCFPCLLPESIGLVSQPCNLTAKRAVTEVLQSFS